MLTAEQIIALLELEPLPLEGGDFRVTYRSTEQLAPDSLPPRYAARKAGPRALAGAIYYLLRAHTCSLLHRLQGDELYHFYLGAPVELLLLHPDGRDELDELVVLGHDLAAGQRVQAMVPHGVWQGSRLLAPHEGDYALMGTTMAPAYDPVDFELGEREALVARYPQRAELIRALTR